ncbi:family 4 glycosyl hydrolase [Enterobacter hormaechei]
MFTPPFILSIAGGGGAYTPGIVKSLMVRLHDFPLAEIRLYDIDEARQNTIAPVVEKVIRDHSQSINLRSPATQKWPLAARILSSPRCASGSTRCASRMKKFRCVTGWSAGNLRGRRAGLRPAHDPADGGAYRSGRSLRARRAAIVNYSNPAAIVAEGVRRLRPNARVLNICDMPVAAMRNIGCRSGRRSS